MIIIGDDEEKSNIFSVRGHGGNDFGNKSIKELINFITQESKKTIKDFN